MKKIIIALCVVGTVFSFANQGQRPAGGTPPAEAISACKGLETGTSCEVQTPRGDTVKGTCENTPDKKYFACKPEHGPRGQK